MIAKWVTSCLISDCKRTYYFLPKIAKHNRYDYIRTVATCHKIKCYDGKWKFIASGCRPPTGKECIAPGFTHGDKKCVHGGPEIVKWVNIK
ncbi:hypothetical protein PoB_002458300 [Plakobranchus ocellatus]|uniref:Uncharacterized protein n=1 Tax=Plakobranchus ocellatus TaxID=259542 RepID=A0AAV3ZUH6_9GAST|nr:hypothetical protein PoB_002458300 [Plakobranchus ocellatus]